MHSLYQTIKEILDAGRVGVPVFVRCTVQLASGSERAGNILARILTMASSWLEASPLEVYAQNSNGSGQITVTIKYTGGQTSIVSVNAAAATRINLMLLGNKGALYHDGEALAPGFDITAEPIPVPEWLLDALERSLRAGEPASIEEVTDLE